MNYWFTTHWPPRVTEPPNPAPYGVWVPDGKLHVIEDLAPGDLIWVYESATAPVEERVDTSGAIERIGSHRGRMGVIGLVEAIEPAMQIAGSKAERYANGRAIWWRYHAKTRPVNTGGYIPMPEAVRLLGYDEAYNFRGFGGGSGLKKIDPVTHDRLLDAFVKSSHSSLLQRLAHPAPARFGPGGEGPDHLALKQRISADPATIMGEPGLRLVEMEMLFPTGDRIDLVLEDRNGSLIAVEVEVDCKAEEVIGPLQCMKYRALLAYRFDRQPLEVRMILVAHSVHHVVREKCARYDIAVVEVKR